MVVGAGAVSIGGAAAARIATATGASSGPSPQDRQVLAFALTLERLQTSFYSQVAAAGVLTGEVREFAETVGAEEHDHLAYLSQVMGQSAGQTQKFNFGDAVKNQAAFLATAIELEDTGVAAYNGQASNLTPSTLADVSRVISVEARHAAWVRDLAGQAPAPVPFDPPISQAQAQTRLARFLA